VYNFVAEVKYMSQTEVESRVAALEKEISLLKAKLDKKPTSPKRTVSVHGGWIMSVFLLTIQPTKKQCV